MSRSRFATRSPDRPLSRLRVIAHSAAWSLLVLGCSGETPETPATESTCLPPLSSACSPLYEPPTFDVIFDRILHPTCAQGMGTCHTSDGAMGGLVFEAETDAYARLLGDAGGRARVTPDEPQCSLLLLRLESQDPGYRMPPGPTPLLDSELCTITQWILQGAEP
jgi:Planctomycete cytochrome C